MTTLFWAVKWDHGFYALDTFIERAITEAVRQRIEGSRINADDIGKYMPGIPLTIRGTETSFTARLERIEPVATFTIDADTEILIHIVTDLDFSLSPTVNETDNSSRVQDLEDMVMFQTTFDPSKLSSHYMKIYESLVGIPKELVLQELLTLLMPFETKEKWSKYHYGHVVPALVVTANKAPVVIMGGDPGTGKTALATSIGAPLAKTLGERVHFRHMSLMLRGMGYQGRASTMVVKLFERIRQEYLRLKEPLLLFFDEAEAIVGSRGETDSSSGAQENVAVVDAIIVGVDGLRKGLQARVVALFATNLTSRIDSAVLRRSYYYAFERPDDKTRYTLFKNSLDGMNFSSADLEKLVVATNPRMLSGKQVQFTPSDIVELIVGRAINEAVRQNKPLNIELLLDYCTRTNPTY